MSEIQQGCTFGWGRSVSGGRQRETTLPRLLKPLPRDAGGSFPGFIDPCDHAQLNSVGRFEIDWSVDGRDLYLLSHIADGQMKTRRLVAKKTRVEM